MEFRLKKFGLLVSPLVCLGLASCATKAMSPWPKTFEIKSVVQGLNTIWDFAFLPSGWMLISERPGNLTLANPKTGEKKLALKFPVFNMAEAGLMGLALSPKFKTDKKFFACYSTGNTNKVENRVGAFVLEGDKAKFQRNIVMGMKGGFIHNGCRIRFGPDGLLYITMGDAGDTHLSQDKTSLNGKVLRVHPDGKIPASNPFKGSPVFTLGHRNPQGLAFHPKTKQPYISEHGQDRDDEINLLKSGKNYGWPDHTGTRMSLGVEPALHSWTPTLALSGAVFYTNKKLPRWDGALMVNSLKAGQLKLIRFKGENFSQFEHEETLIDGTYGRLRALGVGSDGNLYIGTSNRDGRGRARAGDDQIFRVDVLP